MPELSICLMILPVQQTFEDALGSKYGEVLNMMPQLYMQDLCRVLNMPDYGSIRPNNA